MPPHSAPGSRRRHLRNRSRPRRTRHNSVATHPEVDFVVSAIVASPASRRLRSGPRRKNRRPCQQECLVVAGELITAEAKKQGKPLLPSTANTTRPPVPARRPYGRGSPRLADRLRRSVPAYAKSQFASITVQQALNHPPEDGQKDHHRLCNLDEQGVRGNRSLPPVHLPRNACKSLCIHSLRSIPWSNSWMAAYLLKSP